MNVKVLGYHSAPPIVTPSTRQSEVFSNALPVSAENGRRLRNLR